MDSDFLNPGTSTTQPEHLTFESHPGQSNSSWASANLSNFCVGFQPWMQKNWSQLKVWDPSVVLVLVSRKRWNYMKPHILSTRLELWFLEHPWFWDISTYPSKRSNSVNLDFSAEMRWFYSSPPGRMVSPKSLLYRWLLPRCVMPCPLWMGHQTSFKQKEGQTDAKIINRSGILKTY